MKLTETGPDTLVGRSGGGCLAVFGLPFLAAGISFTVAAAMGKVTNSGTGEVTPLFFSIPFGLVFVAVGAALVFGRTGVTIDRLNRQATTWWGLIVPFRSKHYPLDDFKEVRVTKEIRRSDKSTRTVYPVRLAGGSKPIHFAEPQDYHTSRALAERITRFLDVTMVDNSSGKTVRRRADELDESLRERLARTGKDVGWPEPPANMKSTCRTQGDAISIEIPPPGFRLRHMIALGVAMVVPLIATAWLYSSGFLDADFFPSQYATIIPVLVIGLPLVLPLVAIGLPAVNDALKRTTIDASPTELRVTSRGIVTKRQEMPAEELEEFQIPQAERGSGSLLAFLGGTATLVARSDRTTITLRPSVDRGELEWIHDAVQYVVTGSA